MILHTPVLTRESNEIWISARIELETQLPNFPAEVWYRFPEKFEAMLEPRTDAFAATALLIAMYTGEDLEIRGSFSQKLAYSLNEYRNIFHSMLPELYEMIEIKFKQLDTTPPEKRGYAVATAFSGGVDSFYTLWSHLPENQPITPLCVPHGLFVRGLDMRLDDIENHQRLVEVYSKIFDDLALNFISASTNVYQLSEFRINWIYFFGPPLIGAALLLSPFLQRFYIPAGMTYSDLIPHGSSPLIDHLLSTENIDIVHHGSSTSRFDKLKVLTNWPITYHHLRVCAERNRVKGIQNCSTCHKCYRTIASLELLNSLPAYQNFSGRLSVGAYIRWGFLTHLYPHQANDLSQRALKSGRISMAFMIQIAILFNIIRNFIIYAVKLFLSPKQIYWLKRKIYQPEVSGVKTT